MPPFRASTHLGQFMLCGTQRVYLEDLTENARAQMVNIEKTDDQILHLKRRIQLVETARERLAEQLSFTLSSDELQKQSAGSRT